MYKNRELISGLVVLAGGLFFSLYSYANYELGTLSRMGPGMFSFILGTLLAVIGAAIALGAPTAPAISIDARTLFKSLYLIGTIAVFAAIVRLVGLLPSSFLLLMLITLPDHRIGLGEGVILSTSLTVAIYVIFKLLLDINMRLFAWPF